jgi:Tol biopolymer transport system component
MFKKIHHRGGIVPNRHGAPPGKSDQIGGEDMITPKYRRLALFALLATFVALVLVPQASATYPGHNGLIAFNAVTAGQNQIFTVRPNGHDLRQITHVDGDAFFADWSPDGRQIVFELDTADHGTVALMNADGSDLTDLSPSPVCCSGQPSFTPDGKRIVFERFDPNTFDDAIWSMKSDGSDQKRVIDPWPNGAGFATDPNVSPDGNTLSFVGFDGSLIGPPPNFEPAQGLFTSGLDGSNLKQLLPFSSDQAIKQDWAPDGGHLLIGVNANFFHQGDSANIATIRPDGTDLQYLTHYQGGDVNAFAGSYSPDGQWIVFRLEDHGNYALYKMRADGSNLHAILGLSSFRPRNIDWGPRAQSDDGGGDD